MKNKIFLLLPAFMLSSCGYGESISCEEAKARYDEIVLSAGYFEHNEKIEERDSIKMTHTRTVKNVDEKTTVKRTYEVDWCISKSYLHTKETFEGGFIEQWQYIKDGVYYNAHHQKGTRYDEKVYLESEISEAKFPITHISYNLDVTGNSLYFSPLSFLSHIGEKGSYNSAGPGNLKMSFKGKIEDSHISEKINATFTYDDYLIKDAKVSYYSDGYYNQITGEFSKKTTDIKETYKLRNGASVRYPNLKDFEKSVR